MIKDSEVWTWGEKTASVVALASLKMCGVHTVGSTLMPYLKFSRQLQGGPSTPIVGLI